MHINRYIDIHRYIRYICIFICIYTADVTPGAYLPSPLELINSVGPLGIDCEMVGVGDDGRRSVLARVSIVDGNGEVVMGEPAPTPRPPACPRAARPPAACWDDDLPAACDIGEGGRARTRARRGGLCAVPR